MLIILTTHPIQYQVPIWQALARDGRVPFEVWYLTDHGAKAAQDVEFGNKFAWDIDMLSGYPHQILKAPRDVHPASFWKCRAAESLTARLRDCGAKALWIQGWQVAGYWQAVFAARRAGVKLWLRGESNDLAPTVGWKKHLKQFVLGWLFRQVDAFLCIGTANRRLYRRFGVPEEKLFDAPYAVDNERFRKQKTEIESQRREIRKRWGIDDDTFCVLFCGKFIAKKRPTDVVLAARELVQKGERVHLLFVGSGELGDSLRSTCNVVFDAGLETRNQEPGTKNLPPASFAGFLNQTQISEAYVAADCLVLPSDYGETWGLVVNEAMASGLPCIISDHCGSAEDLGAMPPNQ
ncbi:glycosyltransferase family 4 protein, partial [Prosthecobacter sp.]|uniref:glycosyltransferase family 4 protein n=1 Tax=Prosthecobacter sp. TaxID=1965333 RepID=UPI001D62FBA4